MAFPSKQLQIIHYMLASMMMMMMMIRFIEPVINGPQTHTHTMALQLIMPVILGTKSRTC